MSGALTKVAGGLFGGAGGALLGAGGGALGALSGVLGGAGAIVGMIFPPIGVAMSVAAMLLPAIEKAVKGAVNQMGQENGLPKFLQEAIGKEVESQLAKVKAQAEPTDPEIDHAVASSPEIQQSVGNIVKDLTDRIIEQTRKGLDLESEAKSGGKGGKAGKAPISAGSWLQAIAIAMGEIAGDKAAQMVDLSKKMADLNGSGKDLTAKLEHTGKKDTKGRGDIQSQQADNAREFSVVQAQFQATSQEFSILQNTFSNALKSIGEGLTTMGRKG
jgi:hypothetical protein